MEYKICIGINKNAIEEVKEIEAIIKRQKYYAFLEKRIIKNRLFKRGI